MFTPIRFVTGGAASSPTASSISAYTTSSMGAADNHHQQQQVVPAKRTPRPRMDAASLTNQIYDYFFKTVSQLVPSPSATNATTKQVMAVIEKTGVYYTTILGWFLLDQEYNPNDDKLKYLSVSWPEFRLN